ncbi:MAG: superoxide dismutase [Bacteroidales bacterium]|nr:superoxide dismutase [Bacteroidales bacterium]
MIKLPELPFELNALEPYISKRTVEFHYTKHHQGYVKKLNGMIEGTKFEKMTLEDIVKESKGGMFNNAAQVWNHTFYWEGLSPEGAREPNGNVANLITSKFGTFDKFKEEFEKVSAGLFGSGWSWLAVQDGEIIITGKSNADTPITGNAKPLFTCDVWEHAYYLDYQNKRPEYLKNFWNLLDWDIVEQRFNA